VANVPLVEEKNKEIKRLNDLIKKQNIDNEELKF
jgi:hypothetical protein